MYNNKKLLQAIDNVLTSAEDRLTEDEFLQLTKIRNELQSHAGNHLSVKDITNLVSFLMALKEIYDKIT